MNQETLGLLLDIVARVEKNIRDRERPAVVGLVGDRLLVLSDYDYLRDDRSAAAFERRAAERAREIGATRWVFAVPQVWVFSAGKAATRAVSDHPLRAGEQEAITWMSADSADGVDYGLVPYVRRPDGGPVFDDPEIFTSEIRPAEGMPGQVMLQLILRDGDDRRPE